MQLLPLVLGDDLAEAEQAVSFSGSTTVTQPAEGSAAVVDAYGGEASVS